jgi:hypothetical protein
MCILPVPKIIQIKKLTSFNPAKFFHIKHLQS